MTRCNHLSRRKVLTPRLQTRGLSESQITGQIRELLQRVGAFPIKIAGGPYQKPGISDWLVCYEGRFIAIEVKRPGGRLTDKQEQFLHDVEAAGGVAFVAYSVDDVVQALGLKLRLMPLFERRVN